MKALLVQSPQAPVAMADVPIPEVGEGEALLRVEAAAVNPSDLLNVAGRFPHTRFPCIPGRDYAAIVVEGPREWIGAKVFGSANRLGFQEWGAQAEYVRVPVNGLVRRPERLKASEAAAVGVPYVTAWQALMTVAAVQPGETVVVTGARGAVGSAGIQIARWAGARVIRVTRGPQLEGDWVSTTEGNGSERMRELTGGQGADVVFDTVGGEQFPQHVAFMGYRGRLVAIASRGRSDVQFNMVDFYHQEQRIFGVDSLKMDFTVTRPILERLSQGFDRGVLTAPAVTVEPLERGPMVYQSLAQGLHGKWVLTPH